MSAASTLTMPVWREGNGRNGRRPLFADLNLICTGLPYQLTEHSSASMPAQNALNEYVLTSGKVPLFLSKKIEDSH